MLGQVEAVDLVKEFRTFKRKEGLWGAVQDLFSREYTSLRAVDDVSFHITPGEMVGYIGPNGAGKSTTVKMLTGILVPTSGEVRANGCVPYRERMAYTRTIGAVFGQRTQLWWDIAVVESFRLLKRIYDVSDSDYEARMARFDDILAINRYLHQPVRKLSLGERMRCDMVAALLHNPPLLFLDEPTIGLDLLAKENIRQFLKEVNREYGTTILLTTHDLSDIEELCSRLMIIDHGHILFDGPLDELKRMLWRQTQIKFELKDVAQGTAIETFKLPGVDKERLDELTYRFSFDREDFTSGDVIRRVVSTAEIRDIFIEEESIEEIVKRIYTGSTLPAMQQR
ncbi:MAG: ATP-binding cassette domain-containing protein [Bryobacterales bacterium]|nr:ATP-binding cassette domain-containing protein [Bryobacterales bacterium]MDE0294423.1 ATP-binding cassette domain-containing protein [Bryobacterales bacterium]